VPLNVKITTTPRKYFAALDRTTKERITAKLAEVANDPADTRHSKPLEGSDKRTARVGKYRILFEIIGPDLIVSDIGSRGQIYRDA